MEVGSGEVGEIAVRGDVVMRGYWNDPRATAEMIDADGWAATGDLGRRDTDGYITIVDRKGDMRSRRRIGPGGRCQRISASANR